MSFSSTHIWRNPLLRSNLEKYFLFRNWSSISSARGIGELFRFLIRLRPWYSITPLSEWYFSLKKSRGAHIATFLDAFPHFVAISTYSFAATLSGGESWYRLSYGGFELFSTSITSATTLFGGSPSGCSLRKTPRYFWMIHRIIGWWVSKMSRFSSPFLF